jgi:hypothetical protein
MKQKNRQRHADSEENFMYRYFPDMVTKQKTYFSEIKIIELKRANARLKKLKKK